MLKSCLILVLSLAASAASATTYLVLPDGSGDTPSIAAALRLAVSGDVIELGDGVFSGPGNADLDFEGKTLTLRSRSGNPAACVIDPEAGVAAPARILNLVTGEGTGCHIAGIGFRGGARAGEVGGALRLAGTSPRVSDCRFSGNQAWDGGAVHCAGGAPRFERCVFAGNLAANAGGALAASGDASVTLSDCRFTGNGAAYGGALSAATATLTLNGSVLLSNTASTRGGGLYAGDHAQLAVSDCTLAYNDAPAGAGLALATSSGLALARAIVAFGLEGEAVELRFGATAAVSCSDLSGNAGGDWTGALAALAGQDGNLDADPLFCGDAADGNLALSAGSPCSEGASACGAMGAEPVGCAGRRVSGIDFGTLKHHYGGD